MTNQPSTADLSRYLDAAFAACDGASQILNSYFGNLRMIDEKFQAGLVSEADRESEKFIIDLLQSRFPEHGILGEESGLFSGLASENSQSTNGSALWMIDPLDGTTNYIHQFPFFCISIGLEVAGELVLGVVDAPKLGMRCHAVKGGGAFMNGEPIHVSSRKLFKDGLFATGFSAHDSELDEQLDLLTHIVRDSRGIRRAGAAALDMCYVAQGVFDVFWEKNLQPWDTAAGTVIAQEAGAIVTDMRGHAFDPRMKSVLCGTPALHQQVLEHLQSIRHRPRST
jgi:myo-inositol-1(or 4)-monophosphatase